MSLDELLSKSRWALQAGQAYKDNGRNKDAREHFGSAVEHLTRAATRFEPTIEVLTNRALANIHLMELDKALEDAESAIRIDEERFEPWFLQGIALEKLGDVDAAIQSFQRAVKIETERFGPWYHLARNFNKLGDHRSAAFAANEALRVCRSFPGARYERGVAHLGLRQYTEAEEDFRQAMQYGMQDPCALYQLSVALFKQGRLAAAVSAVERIQRPNEKVYVHIAAIQSLRKKHREAAAAYTRALELDQNDDVYVLRSREHIELGLFRTARDDLLSVLERDSAHVGAWSCLGDLYVREGNREGAIGAYEGAVESMGLLVDEEKTAGVYRYAIHAEHALKRLNRSTQTRYKDEALQLGVLTKKEIAKTLAA